MDANHFDPFAKLLATGGTSRRRLLRGVGGGLLGVVLGADEVGANPPPKHCKPQDYACKTNADCCSLNCCTRTCCGDGQSCCGGQCAANCTGGQVLTTGCQCACPSGTVLVGGTFYMPTTTCPTGACGTISDGCGGTLDCGTRTAPQTCGGGGIPNVCGCIPATGCPTGQTCGTAPDGCDGTLTCGSCPSGQTCANGQCASTCDATTCPDGCCDPSGACQGGTSATACGSGGAVCTACASGLTCCGEGCRDTSSDPANCGGCGIACTPPINATATCTAGMCGFTCNTGFMDCHGTCVEACA